MYPIGLAGGTILIGGINNISLVNPPVSILTQPNDVDESMFCDKDNLPSHCKPDQLCNCIHRIKVKLNSVVEMIIVDEARRKGNFVLGCSYMTSYNTSDF